MSDVLVGEKKRMNEVSNVRGYGGGWLLYRVVDMAWLGDGVVERRLDEDDRR